MFSRKRRFYEKKVFHAAVFTAFSVVLSMSLWFSGETVTIPEQPVDPVETEVSTEVNSGQAGISGAEIIERPSEEGYFVVEEDKFIRIYRVEATGEMTLIRTSEILFDLLGEEDQEMFRIGVALKNDEELMELLQDFES